MDIVLSHISALRFWLSRPACSVRLRYADPILPVSALPKGKAAELAVYGGVPVHVLCAGPIKGGVRNGAILPYLARRFAYRFGGPHRARCLRLLS